MKSKVLKKIKFVAKKIKLRKSIVAIGIVIIAIIFILGKYLSNGGLVAGIQESIDRRFDTNAVYAAKEIQEAINNKDYERANDLYVKVQHAAIGSKAYDNLSEVREQIEYYRKYRLAIDAINENRTDQDWGVVINYLANMPNNFKYEKQVKSLLETAIERQKITSISPTIAQKQQNYTAPTLDPDPPVNCKIHANCGGGTTPLKQSECDNSTCCQVNDSWYFYEDKNKCLEDQKTQMPTNKSQEQQSNNYTSNNSNKIPVFISYWNYTVYCPIENVSAAQSINSIMENKKSSWEESYRTCVKNFQNTDSCYVSCKSSSFQNYNFDYGACITTCPSTAEACQWTYSERESMNSQINNLCSSINF